jgi:hypothetical protein
VAAIPKEAYFKALRAEAKGRRIELSWGFDPAQLRRVVEALDSKSSVWTWTGNQDLRGSWSYRHAQGLRRPLGNSARRCGVHGSADRHKTIFHCVAVLEEDFIMRSAQ